MTRVPGDLAVEVTFTVTDQTVSIDYSARAAAATVVNLTNHSYFNLDGETSFGVDDHLLTVEADDFLPVAPDLIPQGRALAVRGPFDLRSPTRVGESVRARDDQLLLTKGIDHHFVVRGTGMRRHARLVGPSSGLRLEVHSDQPGLQVYTGNVLDGSLTGTYGRSYRQGSGIALETQHAPDSPNNPAAPSTVLRPGETYRSTTRWVFSR